jgi:undecaprenyl phosphate N,N'-diacetylbacillosamine 1-phosphate transferase
MYSAYNKRIIDFLFSIVLIILLSPIIVIIILILIGYNDKVFFIQTRVGLGSKEFNLFKFKSMSDTLDQEGKLLPDSQRLTRFGKFLRSSSLDELPQLINVLEGNMSLVGPRPLLPKYLPLYNDIQSRRHEVKPGITGWTQVNGRNSLSWKKKFEMDVWYVENVSFFLDIKILVMTFLKVIKKDGIKAEGSVTGLPFTGNNE